MVNFWITHFKDLVRHGDMVSWDKIDRYDLKFGFYDTFALSFRLKLFPWKKYYVTFVGFLA